MASLANGSEPQAAGDGDGGEPTPTGGAPATATLDPRLLMAARRGDSKQLKDLLLIKDDDEQQQQRGTSNQNGRTPTTVAVAAAQDVIVEVDPPRPPAPGGDAVAVAVVPAPPQSPPPLLVVLDEDDGVTMEGDSMLHVVAACGDTQEFLDCAKMIVRYKEKKNGSAALEARNSNGDTPLHCAAAAGNADMVVCLIDIIISGSGSAAADEAAAKKAFVRTRNEAGETALHQALRAPMNKNKVACIDRLMDVDPELACIPCDCDCDCDCDGASDDHDAAGYYSPLYLAISLGEVEIARHLYAKSKGKLSYSGPHGRNVLHAAVHRPQALAMILNWLKDDDMKPKEVGPAEHNQYCPANVNHHMMSCKSSSSVSSLVSRLTSQRDRKEKGSTPLHLAASLSGWPYSKFLCTRFPQVWPTTKAMATLLLDANESMAYQADDEGSYPIHLAAWSNSSVVKVLLERCPDCATLRDGKGRTFLHVAAEERSIAVVRYVCVEMPQQLSWMILNAKDNSGDTALHNAVYTGNVAVVNYLLRNRLVRLDVKNKDGMTPLDVSWTMLPSSPFQYEFNPRNIVRLSLLYSGAPHGGGRPELYYEKHTREATELELVEESKKYTEATQVTSIVTALIATVTFASAFTLPGGYRATGTPVLAGKSYAFDAFILADTLAFVFSMSATCTLVYAGLPALEFSIRNWYFNVSAFMLQSAARSLVAAFGLGLYLVLAPVDHRTAVAACAIVFATSLYGNMGALEVTLVANTVRTRIGMRRLVVCSFTKAISFGALINFGSYIIIFGLPAILKYWRAR